MGQVLSVPVQHHNSEEHRRLLANAVNDILEGSSNATGSFTLDFLSTLTTVLDIRVTQGQIIVFEPQDADAATEKYSGNMFITTFDGGFNITHSNSPSNPRPFAYLIAG